jgi:hypothetical protein
MTVWASRTLNGWITLRLTDTLDDGITLLFTEPLLDVHCNENPIYVFLFWELRGLSPKFHIHVSVSELYIPRIGQHI